MSGKTKRPASDVVDCELAKRGLWLVKVPRYLSEQWETQAGGSEVGRIEITGKTEYFFKTTQPVGANPGRSALATSLATGVSASSSPSSSSSRLLAAALSTESPQAIVRKDAKTPLQIPVEHRFVIEEIKNQTMIVLSEDKSDLGAESAQRSGRLCVEGRIVRRAECRPPVSHDYLKMKMGQNETRAGPKREVILIEKAEVKFKPVALHAEDKVREKMKKDGAKTVRADKDLIRQEIFHAFEKHQYYRLVDLQKLTQQPPGFVKEILVEIANYNTAPPHKSMWELKSEYRHYGGGDKKAT